MTPALGMLHELIAQRRAAEDAVTAAGATASAPTAFEGPERASLVFVARAEEELGIVGGDIMREASRWVHGGVTPKAAAGAGKRQCSVPRTYVST